MEYHYRDIYPLKGAKAIDHNAYVNRKVIAWGIHENAQEVTGGVIGLYFRVQPTCSQGAQTSTRSKRVHPDVFSTINRGILMLPVDYSFLNGHWRSR